MPELEHQFAQDSAPIPIRLSDEEVASLRGAVPSFVRWIEDADTRKACAALFKFLRHGFEQILYEPRLDLTPNQRDTLDTYVRGQLSGFRVAENYLSDPAAAQTLFQTLEMEKQ